MRYEDFESKKQYLIHVKTVFYKNGMKCMVLSVAVLVLLFAIGAVGYLFSFFIKVDSEA